MKHTVSSLLTTSQFSFLCLETRLITTTLAMSIFISMNGLRPKNFSSTILNVNLYLSTRPKLQITLLSMTFLLSIKLLGVILNSQLNFNSHISYIVSRCSCKLFALRIVSRFLSTHHCINIYQGLIRSVLEYCSPVFVGLGANNSQKLENIQSRAHRIICGPSCDCNKFVSC